MCDCDFESIPTKPPQIFAGKIIQPGKPIDKIKVGIKGDFLKVSPNKQGEFLVDLNNLKQDYRKLEHIHIEVIYKKIKKRKRS